jgi:hAT family C-terminal dimerisation region
MASAAGRRSVSAASSASDGIDAQAAQAALSNVAGEESDMPEGRKDTFWKDTEDMLAFSEGCQTFTAAVARGQAVAEASRPVAPAPIFEPQQEATRPRAPSVRSELELDFTPVNMLRGAPLVTDSAQDPNAEPLAVLVRTTGVGKRMTLEYAKTPDGRTICGPQSVVETALADMALPPGFEVRPCGVLPKKHETDRPLVRRQARKPKSAAATPTTGTAKPKDKFRFLKSALKDVILATRAREQEELEAQMDDGTYDLLMAQFSDRQLKANPESIEDRHVLRVHNPDFAFEPRNGTSMYCALCRKEFDVHKMQKLTQHCDSKKHRDLLALRCRGGILNFFSRRAVEDESDGRVEGADDKVVDASFLEKERAPLAAATLGAGVSLSAMDGPLGNYVATANGISHGGSKGLREAVPEANRNMKEGIIALLKTAVGVSLIYDGTTRVSNNIAVLVRFCIPPEVHARTIVLSVAGLAAHEEHEGLGAELMRILCDYLDPAQLLAVCRDGASVNGATYTFLIRCGVLSEGVANLRCLPHGLDLVGEEGENKLECVKSLFSLLNKFKLSTKNTTLYFRHFGCGFPTWSSTRWWTAFEALDFMAATHSSGRILNVEYFVCIVCQHDGITDVVKKSARKLQSKIATLVVQLAACTDVFRMFVNATFLLEGDGFVGFECIDILERLACHVCALEIGPSANLEDEERDAIYRYVDTMPQFKFALERATSGVRAGSTLAIRKRAAVDVLRKLFPAFQKSKEIFPADGQDGPHGFGNAVPVWKALGLFSPLRVARLVQVDENPLRAEAAMEILSAIPTLTGNNADFNLDAQFNAYADAAVQWSAAEHAAGEAHPDIAKFWKSHATTAAFPAWVVAERIAISITVSSAAAERVFSVLKHILTNDKYRALRDYIEAGCSNAYNWRNPDTGLPDQ